MKVFFKRIFYTLREYYVYCRDIKSFGPTFAEFSNFANKKWDEGASNGGRTRLLNVEIKKIVDVCYIESIIEIFVDEIYKFRADNESPYIIDCGANIGLSTIYFKKLYPKAKVLAFEADPGIAQTTEYNINQFGFSDVEVKNAAVWIENGTMNFEGNGTLGGKLIDVADGETNVVSVPTIRLTDYLKDRSVDLLKMDIEGVEIQVLQDCAGVLNNVKAIFVEFHGRTNDRQYLPVILNILSESGFRYHIKEATSVMDKPFMDYDKQKTKNKPFDMQLNIFGYRM